MSDKFRYVKIDGVEPLPSIKIDVELMPRKDFDEIWAKGFKGAITYLESVHEAHPDEGLTYAIALLKSGLNHLATPLPGKGEL